MTFAFFIPFLLQAQSDSSTFKQEGKVKVVTYDEKTDQNMEYYINHKGEKVK
ncbi:hypothetical protein [Sphingobacterium lumbrici]|uniref:hypothetical protein n=1 Tax=Sphingobacterium lumbrici TaxID=2559600 RepID=UPI0015E40460|nr:hypothetical protein [Sphingobacterium lumbrici]